MILLALVPSYFSLSFVFTFLLADYSPEKSYPTIKIISPQQVFLLCTCNIRNFSSISTRIKENIKNHFYKKAICEAILKMLGNQR